MSAVLDPMQQYLLKLSQESMSSFISNYTLQDDFIINQKNVNLLQYGSLQCSAPEKAAMMDTWFSCILFQLPFFLEKFHFGFIGYIFVLPILGISIFGGIKESYRWFILNQAIWDAFICYDFICAKPTLYGWTTPDIILKQNTCFYRAQNDQNQYLSIALQGFRIFLRNASFIPIFHLTLSRFLCMYFSRFYKNFTKNAYKIFIFIILFNAACILIFGVSTTTLAISAQSVVAETEKCFSYCQSLNATTCRQKVPEYTQCANQMILSLLTRKENYQNFSKYFKYISYSIPPTMFLLSIIFAGFLFLKISSQLKFQHKSNNQESFKQTIKISVVVGFQCLIMSVIFLITAIQKFMQIKSAAVGTYNIYDELPIWLFLLQYHTTTASLNMIRVFLDSWIILAVLSGYSKCVVSTFKFLFLCLTNPKKVFKKLKFNDSRVTDISIQGGHHGVGRRGTQPIQN